MSFKIEAWRLKSHRPVALWYDAYLKSPEWQELRDHIRWARNYNCEECGIHASDTLLIVHHRTYEHVTNEQPEELLLVCEECHHTLHDKEMIPFAERIYDESYIDVIEYMNAHNKLRKNIKTSKNKKHKHK